VQRLLDLGADFAAFARYMYLYLAPESLVVLNAPGFPAAAFQSSEGGQQGDAAFPMTYCVATLPRLMDVKRQLAPCGGLVFAYFDDVYIHAPASDAFTAKAAYERAIAADGEKPRAEKAKVWAPGVPVEDFIEQAGAAGLEVSWEEGPEGKCAIEGAALIEDDGMIVVGVPVGSPGYVRRTAAESVATDAEEIGIVRDALSHATQLLYGGLRFCLAPKADHLARTLYPSDSTVPGVLPAFDEAIEDCARVALGASGDLVFGHVSGLPKLRGRLPSRLGGLGLRRRVDVAPAAFCGFVLATCATLAKCAPAVSDRLYGAGFASDHERGRFRALLSGPSRLGGEFKGAWNLMRAEVKRDSGLPEDASPKLRKRMLGMLLEEASSAGFDGATYVNEKAQKMLTEVREQASRKVLASRLRARDEPEVIDPLWEAFCCADRFSSAFLKVCPATPDLSFTNEEWSETVAHYLGLPSPACLRRLKQKVRCKVEGKQLDAYGDALLSERACLNLENTRDKFWHNSVLLAFAKTARAAGYDCDVRTFSRLVPAVLNEAQQQRLLQKFRDRKAAGSSGSWNAGSIVPDAILQSAGGRPSLVEIKTVNTNKSIYTKKSIGGEVGHLRPVDKRADRIDKEYIAHARKIDRDFAGAERGGGPMEMQLRDYGGVAAVVAGKYGEMNKRAMAFAEDFAFQIANMKFLEYTAAAGVSTPEEAAAVVKQEIVARWGCCNVRARARCLIKLLGGYVGEKVDVLQSQDGRQDDLLGHGLHQREFNNNSTARVTGRPGGRW